MNTQREIELLQGIDDCNPDSMSEPLELIHNFAKRIRAEEKTRIISELRDMGFCINAREAADIIEREDK